MVQDKGLKLLSGNSDVPLERRITFIESIRFYYIISITQTLHDCLSLCDSLGKLTMVLCEKALSNNRVSILLIFN